MIAPRVEPGLGEIPDQQLEAILLARVLKRLDAIDLPELREYRHQVWQTLRNHTVVVPIELLESVLHIVPCERPYKEPAAPRDRHTLRHIVSDTITMELESIGKYDNGRITRALSCRPEYEVGARGHRDSIGRAELDLWLQIVGLFSDLHESAGLPVDRLLAQDYRKRIAPEAVQSFNEPALQLALLQRCDLYILQRIDLQHPCPLVKKLAQ